MGCANTKTGGAIATEEGVPEGGDTSAQKDVPKVMVAGDEVAVNGNVVNANGVEDGTTGDGKEQACNGDLNDTKRTSKAASESAEEENKSGVTTPSGDTKSNEMNGGDAIMADDTQDADEKESSAKDESDGQEDQEESKEKEESAPTTDAAESREVNQED